MADGIDKKIPRRMLQFKSPVNSLCFLLANDSDKAEKKGPTKVTNNAMFVGSTSELQKMLKEMGGGKR